MDFIKTKTVTEEVSIKCNINIVDQGNYVIVRINGWIVLEIQNNGTFRRVGCIGDDSGLTLDDNQKIMEVD